MHIRKKWNKNMEVNGMNNKASITALMSSFGRAFHAENGLPATKKSDQTSEISSFCGTNTGRSQHPRIEQ